VCIVPESVSDEFDGAICKLLPNRCSLELGLRGILSTNYHSDRGRQNSILLRPLGNLKNLDACVYYFISMHCMFSTPAASS
jgi:hypothetical protein